MEQIKILKLRIQIIIRLYQRFGISYTAISQLFFYHAQLSEEFKQNL